MVDMKRRATRGMAWRKLNRDLCCIVTLRSTESTENLDRCYFPRHQGLAKMIRFRRNEELVKLTIEGGKEDQRKGVDITGIKAHDVATAMSQQHNTYSAYSTYSTQHILVQQIQRPHY